MPNEIDEIMAKVLRGMSRTLDKLYIARDIRTALRVAGYEIVPTQASLLARGKEDVPSGKTHD